MTYRGLTAVSPRTLSPILYGIQWAAFWRDSVVWHTSGYWGRGRMPPRRKTTLATFSSVWISFDTLSLSISTSLFRLRCHTYRRRLEPALQRLFRRIHAVYFFCIVISRFLCSENFEILRSHRLLGNPCVQF